MSMTTRYLYTYSYHLVDSLYWNAVHVIISSHCYYVRCLCIQCGAPRHRIIIVVLSSSSSFATTTTVPVNLPPAAAEAFKSPRQIIISNLSALILDVRTIAIHIYLFIYILYAVCLTSARRNAQPSIMSRRRRFSTVIHISVRRKLRFVWRLT